MFKSSTVWYVRAGKGLILPLLCLTELLPPFISQTLRDGTPQVQEKQDKEYSH